VPGCAVLVDIYILIIDLLTLEVIFGDMARRAPLGAINSNLDGVIHSSLLSLKV
jgi:hypothetical protein